MPDATPVDLMDWQEDTMLTTEVGIRKGEAKCQQSLGTLGAAVLHGPAPYFGYRIPSFRARLF